MITASCRYSTKTNPLCDDDDLVSTGYCDDDGNCICNEQKLDIGEEISKTLDGKDIFTYLRDKVRELSHFDALSWIPTIL